MAAWLAEEPTRIHGKWGKSIVLCMEKWEKTTLDKKFWKYMAILLRKGGSKTH